MGSLCIVSEAEKTDDEREEDEREKMIKNQSENIIKQQQKKNKKRKKKNNDNNDFDKIEKEEEEDEDDESGTNDSSSSSSSNGDNPQFDKLQFETMQKEVVLLSTRNANLQQQLEEMKKKYNSLQLKKEQSIDSVQVSQIYSLFLFFIQNSFSQSI